ncbi:hypothetical protein DFJ77DRAFT_472013 [Powellomyces hirtus]|nr:hypothetical protein DFJ77DRAFT_472013 [Powellomyces hirtus]
MRSLVFLVVLLLAALLANASAPSQQRTEKTIARSEASIAPRANAKHKAVARPKVKMASRPKAKAKSKVRVPARPKKKAIKKKAPAKKKKTAKKNGVARPKAKIAPRPNAKPKAVVRPKTKVPSHPKKKTAVKKVQARPHKKPVARPKPKAVAKPKAKPPSRPKNKAASRKIPARPNKKAAPKQKAPAKKKAPARPNRKVAARPKAKAAAPKKAAAKKKVSIRPVKKGATHPNRKMNTVSRVSKTTLLPTIAVLDRSALYFKSYDTIVNVASFQSSGVVTFGGVQYAAWYSGNREAIIARRVLPATRWQSTSLGHKLSIDDSHNVISIAVSPRDGRIHVALDTHSTKLFYIKSEAGLALPGGRKKAWTRARFGPVQNALDGVKLEPAVTYPQFAITRAGALQLFYRSGISGNGAGQLAEYNNGKWTKIGGFTSGNGNYKGPNGVISNKRNLYVNGFTYSRTGRLFTSGTWREQNNKILCAGGGLTNHDIVYAYSDDAGRTWKNNAGKEIAQTGGKAQMSISSPGFTVSPLDPNHGLMNQESQTADNAGNPHILVSYVPGRFSSCVKAYAKDRTANARPFHLWRNPRTGAWVKTELPFRVASPLRSQIIIDRRNDAYVLLPFLRIAKATAKSGYKDWKMIFDGVQKGWKVEGEVTYDRERWAADGVLSVLFQSNKKVIQVADFKLQ